MVPVIRRVSFAALALVLAACTGQPVRTAAPRSADAKASATPAPQGSAIAPPVVTSAAQTLAGVVRAPVTLVSEKGNGIISNNGGGILGKMKRGLLDAPAQAVLAGVTVSLLDAAGKPVNGVDGKPLVATTNANGSYEFTQPLPPQTLVPSVDLGADAGQLLTIAPQAAVRKADLDLVTTLATGYILDSYVRPQADPVQTLAKLPADVEADTFTKAATAVASGKVALPDALTTAKVVATVTALRKADATLDAQMDAVKRLLIPAGQSDLGTGQLATSVSLGSVLGMTVASTGELLLSTVRIPAGSGQRKQGRIWRLGSDGRLAVAIDDANAFVNDAQAPAFSAFAADEAGRVLVIAGNHLGRLEADGAVSDLGQLPATHVLVAVDAKGVVWTSETNAATNNQHTVRLTSQAQGASPKRGAASPAVPPSSPVLLKADGHATLFDLVAGKRHAYAPATDTWSTTPYTAPGGAWIVDPTGHAFTLDTKTRAVAAIQPDGSAKTLVAALPPEVDLEPLGATVDFADLEYSIFAICAAPDGTAYLLDYRGRAYHLADGKATLVAGVPATAGVSGDANAVALEQPVALAALANGDLLVADGHRKQLLRVTTDHKISVYGGNGKDGLATEGQAIADAPLSGLSRVLAASNGDLYLLQLSLIPSAALGGAVPPTIGFGATPMQLLRVGADGVVHVAARVDNAFPVMNGLVLAGSVPYVSSALGGVQRVAASGLEAIDLGAFGLAAGSGGAGLIAGDPSGKLWLAQGPNVLLSCLPPAKPVQAAKDDHTTALMDATTHDLGRGVVDAAGRLCFVDAAKHCVWRFDPKDASFKAIAGNGGPIFAGSTLDDSLSSPKDLAFAADGALLVLDAGSNQVKRIPPDKL